MAREDYASDTGGLLPDGRFKLMDRPMLTLSLHELAMIWSTRQLEQLPHARAVSSQLALLPC